MVGVGGRFGNHHLTYNAPVRRNRPDDHDGMEQSQDIVRLKKHASVEILLTLVSHCQHQDYIGSLVIAVERNISGPPS